MKLFRNIKNYQKGNVLSSSKGFTLIELLVVIGILAILLAITLIAINPSHQFAQANNTKRRSDILQVLNAIGQYTAENKGILPPEVSGLTPGVAGAMGVPVVFSSATSLTTLCAKLSPTYLPSLPADPKQTAGDVSDCTAATWNTGYAIAIDDSNRIQVSAPDADEGVSITITR